MDLSVIIVNYNSAKYLERALTSLQSHLSGLDHEICVVDNVSTEHSIDLLNNHPGLITIFNRTNLGFAAAINQGLKKIHGNMSSGFQTLFTKCLERCSYCSRYLDTMQPLAGCE